MFKPVLLQLIAAFVLLPLWGFKHSGDPAPSFKQIPAAHSGINFINTVPPASLDYIYAANGNGLGVGDFNNDGLQDVFFSANNGTNKLYLNTGNFRFRDVSSESNIEGNGLWGTGVAVADVNGDGLQDVYVSHSGPYSEREKLANQLFINKGIRNGVPVFEEDAAAWGLDLPGTHTTQSAFFDYDKDGDLDVFILNHAINDYVRIQSAAYFHAQKDTSSSNLLLKNEVVDGKRKFINVSEQAGIIYSSINDGLGVVVSDLNNDGWDDIYCTSDFDERDFCYINQKDGSFREVLAHSFRYVSHFSMGVDAADINNDTYNDLVTTDMMPEENMRQKIILANESLDKHLFLQKEGFHYQYVRNMLHINEGVDREGKVHFSEAGQLAGISNTDWSWSALFFDYNNDTRKDLFITAGYKNDYANMDIINNYNVPALIDRKIPADQQKYPPLPLPSRLFQNNSGLCFLDVSKEEGFTKDAVSGACAYADFNNDGRMDLIYSNFDEAPFLYSNVGGQGNHYLKIALKGSGLNTNAIGARVLVKTGHTSQVQEVQPVRGFQSSQDTRLNFGLGSATVADVEVRWPDGTLTIQKNVKASQLLTIEYKPGIKAGTEAKKFQWKEKDVFNDAVAHKENTFIDFKHQYMLPYQLSTQGPAVAEADINGDGRPDFFQGGAKGYGGKFFLSLQDSFEIKNIAAFEKDKPYEDVAAAFTDVDGDGDKDLYVASGGIEYPAGSAFYQDRLYINDGKGNFTRDTAALPVLTESSKGVVAVADYDQDGDEDIFIGGYTVANNFGYAVRSYLLRNDSEKEKIKFTDVINSIATPLKYCGMVNSAEWKDMNKDGYPELFVAAEWNSVKSFSNNGGKQLVDNTASSGLAPYHGLWSAIKVADIDNDGDEDLIAGNAGENLQFKVSPQKPMRVYMADVNDLGQNHPFVSYYIGEKEVPIYFRDEFLEQAYKLRQRFPTYVEYAKADINDIFSMLMPPPIAVMQVNDLRSGIFYQQEGRFTFVPFPPAAQKSRVMTIDLFDENNDGKKELLLAGNFYGYRMRFGRSASMPPLILQPGDENNFSLIEPATSGLYLWQQTRYAKALENGKRLLFFNNNAKPVLYEKN